MTTDKPIVHHLKSWPEFFAPVLNGEKTFELRRNDRDFKVGDILVLREWEPLLGDHDRRLGAGSYTGREVKKRITYILEGAGNVGTIAPLKGLSVGYAILGLGEPPE